MTTNERGGSAPVTPETWLVLVQSPDGSRWPDAIYAGTSYYQANEAAREARKAGLFVLLTAVVDLPTAADFHLELADA